MEDPIPNDARKRGRAGVAILWRKNLSHLVHKQPDGSDRIAVIVVECIPKPICIINTYLPSQGSTDFRLQYSSHLDQLHEIRMKYPTNEYITILGGDLNASLLEPKYPHDLEAKAAIEEMELHLPTPYPTSHSFFSHNGRDSRLIDYIASSHPNIVHVDEPIQSASNTSSHNMVSAEIEVSLHIPETAHPTKTSGKCRRVKWDKADIYLYKQIVCKEVGKIEGSDIRSIHDNITEVLTNASSKATPQLKNKSRRSSRIPLTTEIKHRLNHCRQLHRNTPPQLRSHNPTIKTAKKLLRKSIRIENAKQRQLLYKELMQANSDKDVLFYKLINKQRGSKKQGINSLKVDGKIVNDPPALLQVWSRHFEKLGSQEYHQHPHFDQRHKERIEKTRKCISEVINLTKPYKSAKPVTTEEVKKAISKLNSNKAADQKGLTAEHLKLATPHILKPLSKLFSICMQEGIQPSDFANGSLTPVGKKGKDLTDPNNSRGIVVSLIISKAYEHIVDGRQEETDSTDDLQFGFTKDKSPTMAALVATEVQAENKDLGKPTYMASLDTQKAFDVVWQDSLAIRLFTSKPVETWKAHMLLLENTNLQVRQGPDLSAPFKVDQGVGQGKILSTKNYKEYIDPSLKIYKTSRAGCFIGIYYVGTPTCADDVLLITSSPEDLQYLLNIAYEFSRQERFIIHPQKTKVIICDYKGPTADILHEWAMGDTQVTPSPSLTHLGINRYANPTAATDVIQDRIKTARRTACALLGAGFHGKAGVGNPCLKKMLDTYVTPRLLYGLEALLITSKQKSMLESFTRDLLKKLQCLPSRTANEAPYILLNILPMEAQLDMKILSFFGKIIADKSSILYQISVRQLATKSLQSNSWFITILKLCLKYNLPSPHSLIHKPPKATQWKKQVKKMIYRYWQDELCTKAEEKSTLTLIQNPADPPSWKHVDNNTHAVSKMRLQTRLLTNTYTLQTHRAKFYKEDPTCRLCGLEEETVIHMLTSCPSLSYTRNILLHPIMNNIRNCIIASTPEEIAKVLLGVYKTDEKTSRMISTACYKLVHLRQLEYTRVTLV